jgi:hypothetical protein
MFPSSGVRSFDFMTLTNMEIKTTTNTTSQQLGNYQHLYNLSRIVTKDP